MSIPTYIWIHAFVCGASASCCVVFFFVSVSLRLFLLPSGQEASDLSLEKHGGGVHLLLASPRLHCDDAQTLHELAPVVPAEGRLDACTHMQRRSNPGVRPCAWTCMQPGYSEVRGGKQLDG